MKNEDDQIEVKVIDEEMMRQRRDRARALLTQGAPAEPKPQKPQRPKDPTEMEIECKETADGRRLIIVEQKQWAFELFGNLFHVEENDFPNLRGAEVLAWYESSRIRNAEILEKNGRYYLYEDMGRYCQQDTGWAAEIHPIDWKEFEAISF